ncbi:unnamed protein product [Caenorhabditis brenneri]
MFHPPGLPPSACCLMYLDLIFSSQPTLFALEAHLLRTFRAASYCSTLPPLFMDRAAEIPSAPSAQAQPVSQASPPQQGPPAPQTSTPQQDPPDLSAPQASSAPSAPETSSASSVLFFSPLISPLARRRRLYAWKKMLEDPRKIPDGSTAPQASSAPSAPQTSSTPLAPQASQLPAPPTSPTQQVRHAPNELIVGPNDHLVLLPAPANCQPYIPPPYRYPGVKNYNLSTRTKK